jgi:hypothetical protein
VLTTVLLDRLLHRSNVLNLKDRSYRLRDLEEALRASASQNPHPADYASEARALTVDGQRAPWSRSVARHFVKLGVV